MKKQRSLHLESVIWWKKEERKFNKYLLIHGFLSYSFLIHDLLIRNFSICNFLIQD